MKKNRNKEENHYYIQWGVATMILLVYVVGTLVSYNAQMKDISLERVLDKVVRQAIEVRGYYEGKTKTTENIADYAAAQISKLDDMYGSEAVELINGIVEEGEFNKAYIVDTEGNAIDNNGKKTDSVDNSEAYNGMLNGKVSVCTIKGDSGEPDILVSAPIKKNEVYEGYVIFQYTPDDIAEIIDNPVYSYGLVYESGQVVETAGDYFLCNRGENLIDSVKAMTFTEGSYSIFAQGISGNRSVTSLITDEKGNSYYLIVQPIKEMDSEIVIVAKESQIMKNANKENNYTGNMIKKLIISLAVFTLLMIVIYLINRLAFSKTNEELKNKAETDLLTGLLNKVSTETKIKEYMADEGKNTSSMMCVLDIDNFKKINDTMGHAFGDEVLASLGRQIGSEFRVTDIIGRTGGDEFIIFLKDLNDKDIILKEASRVEMFFRNFTVGDYTKYSATASIGVALFPSDGKDFDSLYKAADSALYKAKKRGKNQLAFYRDPE